MKTQIRIWDLPTRLFHWLLVTAMIAAFVTGELGGGLMDWHGRIGLGIVGLLAFRLVWGVWGSTYARFIQFFPTPAKIRAYLAGEWRRQGHNPLGALSVLGLLGIVGLQLATGLVANDDIAFRGPLLDLVGRDWSDRLTSVHHLVSKGILLLVALHVGAIMFYAHVRKHNLVRPMLTGEAEGEPAESAQGGGFLALLVALVLAAGAVYLASGAWMPAPPPPPVVETPNF